MESPAVRRVVTGHDARGRAVVRSDALIPFAPLTSGDAGFALLWTTLETPADNDDPADRAARSVGLAVDRGTVLRVVEMLPGCASPMHRTESVDYGIVIEGEVELLLDDGSATLVRQGEVVVQRGTIHAWRNPDEDRICRMAFVLVGARPIEIGGRPLARVDI